MYKVTVKDKWCSVRGRFEEEMEVATLAEAQKWAAEWRGMYAAADGYVIKITKQG